MECVVLGLCIMVAFLFLAAVANVSKRLDLERRVDTLQEAFLNHQAQHDEEKRS